MLIAIILIALAAILFTGLILAGASVRVLREYERAVIFRLGRLIDEKGPGLSARPRRRSDGPRQPAHGDAPHPAAGDHHARQHPRRASTRSSTSGRRPHAVGRRGRGLHGGDSRRSRRRLCARCWARWSWTTLLAERERLNESSADHRRADRAVGHQGHDGRDQGRRDPARTMQRAMARQAEAERERRAKVIAAEGEFQAAAKLAQAAEMIAAAIPWRCSCATCRRWSRYQWQSGIDDRVSAADRLGQAAAGSRRRLRRRLARSTGSAGTRCRPRKRRRAADRKRRVNQAPSERTFQTRDAATSASREEQHSRRPVDALAPGMECSSRDRLLVASANRRFRKRGR